MTGRIRPLPQRVLLVALDLGLYGVAVYNTELGDLLDRLRVDATFARVC